MAGISMTTAAPTLTPKNPTAASQPLQGEREGGEELKGFSMPTEGPACCPSYAKSSEKSTRNRYVRPDLLHMYRAPTDRQEKDNFKGAGLS